ncbi:unnamed protein product [Urochloa humidicola]
MDLPWSQRTMDRDPCLHDSSNSNPPPTPADSKREGKASARAGRRDGRVEGLGSQRICSA